MSGGSGENSCATALGGAEAAAAQRARRGEEEAQKRGARRRTAARASQVAYTRPIAPISAGLVTSVEKR